MVFGVAAGLWLRLGSVFTFGIWYFGILVFWYFGILVLVFGILYLEWPAAGLWLRLGSVFTQRSSCVAAARS